MLLWTGCEWKIRHQDVAGVLANGCKEIKRCIDVRGWSNLNIWNNLYMFISSLNILLALRSLANTKKKPGACLTDVINVHGAV